jgi:hypothetical protein
MKGKGMDFLATQLPIIGGLVFAVGLAMWTLPNISNTTALWTGTGGTVMVLLGAACYLQQTIWRAGSENESRPYLVVTSLGFPNILIQAGPVVIVWSINNTGSRIARITDANMTVFLERPDQPLPQEPAYQPNRRNIVGATLSPNEVFNSHLDAFMTLTPADVTSINNEIFKFYVYGYVRYQGGERAFIARYNPKNTAAAGMFNRVESEYPKYGRNK